MPQPCRAHGVRMHASLLRAVSAWGAGQLAPRGAPWYARVPPRAYVRTRTVTVAPQVKPGKGPAFVRTKLKNIETRATLDKTWRAGESYPDADVDKQIMQYSYIDGDDHVFMNMVRP